MNHFLYIGQVDLLNLKPQNARFSKYYAAKNLFLSCNEITMFGVSWKKEKFAFSSVVVLEFIMSW